MNKEEQRQGDNNKCIQMEAFSLWKLLDNNQSCEEKVIMEKVHVRR